MEPRKSDVIGWENAAAYLKQTTDTLNKQYDERLQAGNLIYIYGPSGSGKTFLLHSVYTALNCHGKATAERALFYRMPDFTEEYVDAILKGTTRAFEQRLYRAEAVLFDDVDYLTGKTQTQEEFDKFVNHCLEDNHTLMIVTGSNSPDNLLLSERLRNRLSWGKVIELRRNESDTDEKRII